MFIRKSTTVLAIAAVLVISCTTQTENQQGTVSPISTKTDQSKRQTNQPVPLVKTGPAKSLPETTATNDAVSTLELRAEEQMAAGSVMPRSKSVHQEFERDRLGRAPMAYKRANILHDIRYPLESLDRERYAHLDDNSIKLVSEHPVSTFSIDVDTGSYSNVRRMVREGRLPPKDAVRVEELINYFDYAYRAPRNKKQPFNVVTEMGPTPWNSDTRLLHIGIKGYDIAQNQLPPANLVFLVDVSGSMRSANKIGLLKSSLKLLTKKLRAEDRISIVVYAGASGVVLEPTSGNDKAKIMSALDSLTAGGSTNGAAGIRLAYQMAQQGFMPKGINRVLLATDGDFNVGTVNFEALKNLVEQKRKSGVTLTTLGFGSGNYNDHLMEQLADVGNGNYAYIDTLSEAQKVLINQMSSTFKTIAKDVKIQIEFNPNVVAEYRLIGYENRLLNREDFNNDKIDAGEIGAGHTVTALYEIVLVGGQGARIDPLRYGHKASTKKTGSNEVAFLKLRYKMPKGNKSTLVTYPINKNSGVSKLAKTSDQFRFSASVAGFGQLLKGGKHTGELKYQDVLQLARGARGDDPFGYRSEFINLVNLTQSIAGEIVQTSKHE